MFYPLINRQDRNVTGAAKPPMLVNALEVDQHAIVAIGQRDDAIDKIGSGQVEAIL